MSHRIHHHPGHTHRRGRLIDHKLRRARRRGIDEREVLEQIQRDLEQATADVAERIKRLDEAGESTIPA